MPTPRIIQLVHSTPGRVRLRLPWLREEPDEAAPLADHLAGLDETVEVQVRPWTGSVLCIFDPERLGPERIVAAVRQHTRVAIVLRPGERPPHEVVRQPRPGRSGVSTIRRAVVRAFDDMDRDIVDGTGGRLDLGALTGLGFLAVGAAEIVTSRTVPAPPWFNLAWWAYRTFTISGEPDDAEAPASAEPAGPEV